MGLEMSETHLWRGRQTVKAGLIKVAHDLFPEETLKISHSIVEGVFCNLDGSVLSTREVKLIEAGLRSRAGWDALIQLLGEEGGYLCYRVEGSEVSVVCPAYQ